MTLPPLAHAGHWFYSALYVAPIAVIGIGLWLSARKDAREDAADQAVRESESGSGAAAGDE